MQGVEAEHYNRVALGVNAPIYAFYADRILKATGIREGVCLDVGCGGGYLGLALAEITELDLIFLDQSETMLHFVQENLCARGASHRGRTLHAPVQAIPLEDASVDLVISRGSVGFWQDLPKAFGELRRVLRPGGKAYIGGGLGPPELREELHGKLCMSEPDWAVQVHRRPIRDRWEYASALRAAGIPRFTVTRNDLGTWIEFTREVDGCTR